MPRSKGPRLPRRPASKPGSKAAKPATYVQKVRVTSKIDMPPLADERPQLIRWIGVRADGSTYPTSRERAHGFELSEPYSDDVPAMPWSYWKGRSGAPR